MRFMKNKGLPEIQDASETPVKKGFSFGFKKKAASTQPEADSVEVEAVDVATPESTFTEPAEVVNAEAGSLNASVPEPDATKKKSFFSKKKKETQATVETLKVAMPLERPIQIWIGYLAEVTEKDAKAYALGVAEKHNEQVSLSYYDVFKFKDGYVYEVHEGGAMHPFMPTILAHFNGLGNFSLEESNAVYIRTAKRVVQVDRTRDGITAMILPESSTAKQTSWLTPAKTKMRAVMNTFDHYLIAGAVFFMFAFIALIAANLGRVQPYIKPVEQESKKIDYFMTPMSQWSRVNSVPEGKYVKVLRFKDGKWDMQIENVPSN